MNYLEEINKLYNLDVKNINILEGGFLNKKFILESTYQKKYVLKDLCPNKFEVDYTEDLKTSVNIQNYLSTNNIKVPIVIPNKDGLLITKLSDMNYYYVQMFIEGKSYSNNELNMNEIYSTGKNLAMLHKKLEKLDNKILNSNYLKFKTSEILENELYERKAKVNNNSTSLYIEELKKHESIINDIRNSRLLLQQKLQIIHGDLTPDNIIYKNDEVNSFIDFELVRVNSKLQDIGRFLLSVCLNDNKLDYDKINHFILGYSNIIDLNFDDVINSFKMVWINEANIWINDDLFKMEKVPKVEKFISDIMWIGENWFNFELIKNDFYNKTMKKVKK